MNDVALRANDVLRNDVGLRSTMLRFAQTEFSPSCLEKHPKVCYNKPKKGGGMMTFRVSHFENKRFLFAAFNGGKLYVTDDEYIIKWLFVKIRFPRDKTQIVFSSDFFLWKCYYFKSGKRKWEVQFSSNVAEEFSKYVDI